MRVQAVVGKTVDGMVIYHRDLVQLPCFNFPGSVVFHSLVSGLATSHLFTVLLAQKNHDAEEDSVAVNPPWGLHLHGCLQCT